MSSTIIASPAPGMRRFRAKRGLSLMQRRVSALALVALVCIAAPAQCQEGAEWDRARAALMAEAPGSVGPAIARWKTLQGTETQGFDSYASFVLAWPGFPGEEAMRRAAEHSLTVQNVDSARLVGYFDRFPPLTNPARASYALALAAVGRTGEAAVQARAAWRGGAMSDVAEATILARYGRDFTQDDHDSRLESLLWDGAIAQAQRALPRASAAVRGVALARLALQSGVEHEVPMVGPDPMEQVAARTAQSTQGSGQAAIPPAAQDAAPGFSSDVAPAEITQITPPSAPAAGPTPAPAPVAVAVGTPPLAIALLGDPGYLYDRARFLIRHGRPGEAATLLAAHPPLSHPALDARKWVSVHLVAARTAGAAGALHIAQGALQGFGNEADVAQMPFAVRDDFTSLMWLGASQALWGLNDPDAAAPLFYRYATAARTPMTRAKGFYWAGRALAQTRDHADMAQRYFEGAAQYAEGLASTTYGQQQQQFQQQFQNYLQQNQQIYSMLGGESTLGQNAAATTGTQGLTATGQSGSYLTAGAAAGAAGQVGSANAIAGGLSGIGNSANSTALLLGLNNSGLFGGGTSA